MGVGNKSLAWTLTVALLGAIVVTLAVPGVPAPVRVSLWGLVLLASLSGWGRLLARLAFPSTPVDLGLGLAWGLGGLIFAGGLLSLLSLATKPVLAVLVIGGAALAAGDALRWSRRARQGVRAWPAGVLVVLGALAVLVAVQYYAGASGANLNPNDDHAAYLVYPKEILATGTLIEPFSVRRLGAYGGQSLLHAVTLIGAFSPLAVPLLDIGLSSLIVLALILGAADDDTPRALLVLPALLVVTLPNTRINTASEMSGVVLFLALYRTATWRGAEEHPGRGAVLLGLLAAAACTLRQSYLPVALAFVGLLHAPALISALRARRLTRNPRLRPLWCAGAATALFLLPWVLLCYRSSKTFLFPLMAGNYRREFGEFATSSNLDERIRFFWTNICHLNPIRSLPVFLLAGATISWRDTRGALAALLWASLIGFVLVVYSFPLADPPNLARYYYAFDVASVLAVTLASISLLPRAAAEASDRKTRLGMVLPLGLVLAAVVAQLMDVRSSVLTDTNHFLDDIRTAPSAGFDRASRYRALQAAVPPGAPLLAMLDEPFWLDFRSNPVKLLDLPGAASPAPGMPLDDDEALVRYLDGQGYRYVAFIRPTMSRSLYRRDHWTKISRETGPLIWRIAAPFYLHMFDRIDGLIASRARLYDDGQMVVLDLAARATP